MKNEVREEDEMFECQGCGKWVRPLEHHTTDEIDRLISDIADADAKEAKALAECEAAHGALVAARSRVAELRDLVRGVVAGSGIPDRTRSISIDGCERCWPSDAYVPVKKKTRRWQRTVKQTTADAATAQAWRDLEPFPYAPVLCEYSAVVEL